jgi:hypothetical protein
MWRLVDPSEVKIGDLVEGVSYTNSQKYINKNGFEMYNRTIYGKVHFVSDVISDIRITDINTGEMMYIADPGTSGGCYISVFTGSDDEKDGC